MIKILALADTHLGFDYPLRPRIMRRRRGFEFFKNYEHALALALEGKIDIVVHGGDIMYRSRVPRQLVDVAFAPLRKIADRGIPVYVVPGNHERSMIPFRILAAHPNIFIFDRPMSFYLETQGQRCVLAGFPFIRHGIRDKFQDILKKTDYHTLYADVYILCMHQSVDGCTMGPKNHMFRGGDDVVNIHQIPVMFSCVLTGHMHRTQVITRDLKGVPLATPVLYPGSIERTSFAEKNEKKGFFVVSINTRKEKKHSLTWEFHELATRPMVYLDYNAVTDRIDDFWIWFRGSLRKIPENSIVKVRISGEYIYEILKSIRLETVRTLAPDTMNISISMPRKKYSSV